MSGDRVHVHVDRLVLDDIGVAHADGPGIAVAVQAELARLLREPRRVPEHLRGGAHLARVRGGGGPVPAGGDPHAIGAGIARSVHAALVGPSATTGAQR
jgi:hypothetical protein